MAEMSAMAPVILGAGGMLGRHLTEVLEEDLPQTVSATRDEIDITDYWEMRWELERLEASVVINCAAFTNVDGCETQEALARQVNADGAGNISRACKEVGARLIHISTDFVFDGLLRRPYREEDATHPISLYGRTKLEGELAVAGETPDHLIVRVSWLYGPYGRNFISAILDAAKAGKPLKIVEDQVGTPTYTEDLAHAIRRLLEIEHTGLLHFANSGECNRADFAVSALQLAGLPDVPVERIASDELDLPARRPLYSSLDTSRYVELTGETPQPWENTLRNYLGATGVQSGTHG
jgi:dTDP-4-dehydrorhamnose reductase